MNFLQKNITQQETKLAVTFILLTLISIVLYAVGKQYPQLYISINLLLILLGAGELYTFLKLMNSILARYENYMSLRFPISHLIFMVLHKILRIVTVLIALYFFTILLPMSLTNKELLSKIINGMLIILAGWFVLQLLSLAEDWYYKHYIRKNHADIIHANSRLTKIKILRQIISLVVIVLTFSSILMLFNHVRALGISLLASAGFITAIIGFAAQKPLAAIFTNFNLAFSQPIKIDDIVVIENEFGRIEEITMNFVVVKLWDSRRIVVPCTYFIDNPFQNWTYKKTNLLGTVFLYVDYSLPLSELRDELNQQLERSDLWDGQVSNLQVTDFKPNCIELRILVSASTPEKLWDLRVYVREKCVMFLNQYYPQCFPRQRMIQENTENKANQFVSYS